MRVAVRNIRRDANSQLKMFLKEKVISEDEDRVGETSIQSITDAFISEIDEILKKKESDLSEI